VQYCLLHSVQYFVLLHSLAILTNLILKNKQIKLKLK